MLNDKKIAVLGAGIVGINCAIALQEAGFQVTLIDKSGIGEGCSKGNAGHFATEQVFPLAEKSLLWQLPKMLLDPLGPIALSPSYFPKALPWFLKFISNMFEGKRNRNKRALKTLNELAIQSYRDLLTRAGAEHLMVTDGSLFVFETKDRSEVEKHYNMYKNEGVAVELLDREQTFALEPNLNRKINFSLYFTEVGHTRNPHEVCTVLAAYAQSIGVEVIHDEIQAIKQGQNCATLVSTKQEYSFDNLLVATGAWSKKVVEQLGYKLPLEVERGYSLDLAATDHNKLSRPVASAERKFIITPMSHGLRFAGTVEFAGLEQSANMERAHMLHRNAYHVLAHVPNFEASNAKDEQQWMGFRPSLPDSLPVIGKAPRHENIYFALGHQHLGLTLGAITGELIKQVFLGEQTKVDISPFCISRFD